MYRLPLTLMQRPSAAVTVERDVLMYRAYIAQVSLLGGVCTPYDL